MRTLAIGDIHGCRRALETLLRAVSLTREDLLITLGDYVDRGPDSKGVIDCLIDLQETHRVVCLLGNHELMMVEALESRAAHRGWLTVGGRETMASFKTKDLSKIPRLYWEFFSRCRPYYEIDTHFFVHANVDPTLPLEQQTEDALFWEPFVNTPPHQSGKTMVCGHTQQHGRPRNLGHAVCIDTSAYCGGWLTCLNVTSGKYWQANEAGDCLTGALIPPAV